MASKVSNKSPRLLTPVSLHRSANMNDFPPELQWNCICATRTFVHTVETFHFTDRRNKKPRTSPCLWSSSHISWAESLEVSVDVLTRLLLDQMVSIFLLDTTTQYHSSTWILFYFCGSQYNCFVLTPCFFDRIKLHQGSLFIHSGLGLNPGLTSQQETLNHLGFVDMDTNVPFLNQ